MRVVICGAGQVGISIAKYLSTQSCDVAIIDQSQELIDEINNNHDVQGFVGKASRPDVLKRAGLEHADILIAVTQIDEVNMIACQIAHTIFGTHTKIARIRDPIFADPRWRLIFSDNQLPVDLVLNPELAIAERAASLLSMGNCFDHIAICENKVRVIGVKCHEDCPIINTPLRELTRIFSDLEIMILGIIRDEELIIPDGRSEMLKGDMVYFSTSDEHSYRAISCFGNYQEPAKNIRIIGAGRVGNYLAGILNEKEDVKSLDIRIIDKNSKQSKIVAESHPNISAFEGNILEKGTLEKFVSGNDEAVVALTNSDEVNILTSVLAQSLGAQRTMALVSDQSIPTLASGFGVDVILGPQEITLSMILGFLRSGSIKKVHALYQGTGELLEVEVLETMPIAGKTIKQASLPRGSIIGAIIQHGKFIIPKPDSIIKPGDYIVILCASNAVRKIEKLISVGINYF